MSELIAALRPGEVVSYGEVAEWAGRPGAARAVGQVLAHSEGLPWWRVVTAAGRLTPGHELTQARRLAAENVTVSGTRVVGFADRSRKPARRVTVHAAVRFGGTDGYHRPDPP